MPPLFLLAMLASAKIAAKDSDDIGDNDEDDVLDMTPVPEKIQFGREVDDVRDILAALERVMAAETLWVDETSLQNQY